MPNPQWIAIARRIGIAGPDTSSGGPPPHREGIAFAFFYRFVTTVFAVVVGSVLLFIYNLLRGEWHLTINMLLVFGLYVTAVILFGEHIRSQIYERYTTSKRGVTPHSRWVISYRAVTPLAMVSDALIIIAMSILTGISYQLETLQQLADLERFAGLGAVVAALFIASGKIRDTYKLSEMLNFKSQVWKITLIWALVFLFLTAVAFTMKVGGELSRGATLSFALSGLAALIVARAVWRAILADGLALHRFAGPKILLITEQSPAVDSDLLSLLSKHGLKVLHHFVLPANLSDAQRCKDIIAEVISSARGSDVEEIIVGTYSDNWKELSPVLSELRVLPLPVNLVPIGPKSDFLKLSSRTIGDAATIELQRGPQTLFERVIKRFFDLIVAGTSVVLLLPLFVVIAIAIKVETPGPMIIRQRRVGFNGRQFYILKFRTTVGHRVTRVGNFLRRTSIDELPQLFNVLQGTMSTVGPRPHAAVHHDKIEKLFATYAYRHHVKPGLTGWAQVNGYRGELRTLADIEQRVRYDLWYIDNWSLALDFKIILMTLVEVMLG